MPKVAMHDDQWVVFDDEDKPFMWLPVQTREEAEQVVAELLASVRTAA